MKNYIFALGASLLLVVSCSTSSKVAKKGPSALRVLIADGNVRVEQSYSHDDKKARSLAASKHKHSQFKSSSLALVGRAWVEESSEYELLPKLKSEIKCQVKISRESQNRAPAAKHQQWTYNIKVTVSDGIKGNPFESVINGESEGSIQLGEYPIEHWSSSANIIVNDTVIESWSYNPDQKYYHIVKKMGEEQWLKKELTFDPYLKKVSSVKYEILQGSASDTQDKTVLARLHCKS